ncbi:hypothetical protein F2Q69_00046726 [Brassica cretica]|uniref:Uncharacterized protein n=1 Tax=Brassica cretica TaxID=69181 RepID=A0A8S9PZC9_BRACR|nr:hypothetical protein F2Q69_00046726 [Brassica cretica]
MLIWTGGRLESLKLRLGLQGASFEHQSMASYSLESLACNMTEEEAHESRVTDGRNCLVLLTEVSTRLCNVLYLYVSVPQTDNHDCLIRVSLVVTCRGESMLV